MMIYKGDKGNGEEFLEKVTATITKESVTVGKQIHIEAKTKNVRYASSDPVIATVSDEGVVTGKKQVKS